jgi:hypothetical protein
MGGKHLRRMASIPALLIIVHTQAASAQNGVSPSKVPALSGTTAQSMAHLYTLALSAHLSGDDALSLESCTEFLQLKSSLGSSGTTPEFTRDQWGRPMHFAEIPKLAADEERRMHEPAYTPVLTSGQPASGPERIAALVRDLELVAARQEMNPGDTELDTDPIVQALISEGQPAVEPLLKCLENDPRLTRSEYTSGMFWGPGEIMPVYEAAYAALSHILDVTFAVSGDPHNLSSDARHALAAEFRAVWQKNKGLTLAEIGFRTLQDDNASAQDWFHAIDNIVQPADGSLTDYHLTMPIGNRWGVHLGTGPFIPRGESLREKSNPSVSDLIIKRTRELLDAKMNANRDLDNLCHQIVAQSDWYGPAHQDDLRNLGKELSMADKGPDPSSFDNVLLSLSAWDGARCQDDLRELRQELDELKSRGRGGVGSK